ncbi:MAG: polysaccharide biosynthesis protein [Actinomycetota bacterium]|nr:polysaccharide biosynthesis protein [Actinomycetota bacterium]
MTGSLSELPAPQRETRWARLASQVVRARTDLPLAFLDCGIAVAAYTGLLLIRFDGLVPAKYARNFPFFLAVAVVAHLLANWGFGLYGQMWRHASVQEARAVVLAGMSATCALAVLFLSGRNQQPLSVVLLGGGTTMMLVGGVRFQSRLFAFRRNAGLPRPSRVAVMGAGDSGAAIVRDMLRSPEAGLVPVAVLDDDPRKQGRSLHGIPIIGGLGSVAKAVERYGADQALLAIPSADGELVRTIARAADDARITLKVLPSVSELVTGRVSVRDVRDVQITDLLGRNQVSTDLEAVRAILHDQRVLITGGGGSIGSEIARQVADCDPALLLLLDHDETHLYDASSDLDKGAVQLLADVRDRDLVDRLFSVQRPDVVFHAAAHKHVPLLESHPCEAIATNILGTLNVIDAARRHGVGRFVLISTDKAVRPTSVMGASKRIGEQIVLSRCEPGLRYCAVRFGNVLGSRGSVIPRFMRQIEEGGPITVTDPRMTRFFMSTSEAVQLVLQAAVFSQGGEVFMLDMGEPVRILELAERMIRLSGRNVGTDIPIRITGVRPGEKLTEELRAPDEPTFPTPHPSILALHPPLLDPTVLTRAIERLAQLARDRDDAWAAREILEVAQGQGALLTLVPDVPSPTLSAWRPNGTP